MAEPDVGAANTDWAPVVVAVEFSLNLFNSPNKLGVVWVPSLRPSKPKPLPVPATPEELPAD